MQHTPLLTTFAVAFVLAFTFGAIAHRLRVPPIVGYLLAGIAVGPYTPGFVADIGLAKQLAEMGIILLMFGVGLHFSVRDMVAVGQISLPGAAAQIAAGTALGLIFSLLMGWSVFAGVVFGFTMSVASTVVLLRALDDRKLLQTRRGQIAVGWLIAEDLAVILALVLLPTIVAFVNSASGPASADGLRGMAVTLGLTVAKLSAFVAVMLLAGRRVIPWLLGRIAMTGSRELFTLAILAIALGVAFVAAKFAGASFALGAFFAGVVLAGSELSQNAAERTLPLRDAFAVLFFVSVGMLFNPNIIVTDTLALVVVILIIVVGKSIAAFAIVRAFGYPRSTAALIAVSLAQIGEFSFILGGLALSLGVLPKEAYDLLLGGAIFSILLNPLLFNLLDRFGARLDDPLTEVAADDLPATPVAYDLSNHVIVIGYGRVGRHISAMLKQSGRPFVIIDPQKDRIDGLAQEGVRAVHGTADRPEILLAAGIRKARALLVAIPNAFDAGAVVSTALELNPELTIIARANFEAEADYIRSKGAGIVLIAEQELARRMTEVVPGAAQHAAQPADG